jgi:hypothetical protein
MKVKQRIRPLIVVALVLSLAGILAAGFGQPDYTLKLD